MPNQPFAIQKTKFIGNSFISNKFLNSSPSNQLDINAIEITENREAFRDLMIEIGVPMAPQKTAKSFLEGKEIAQEFGFPLCIRPSYTLGGSGASILYEPKEFDNLLERGLQLSPIHEVMIDKALIGWKEYELELLRDANDNVVIICSIENFDPM